MITHTCDKCGDAHLPPAKNTPSQLRAAGWSDDYIERHQEEKNEIA